MAINIKNFLNVKNKLSKMRDFQDLGHLDGISISAINPDSKRERSLASIFLMSFGYLSLERTICL